MRNPTSLKIFLVDDDPFCRSSYKHYLKHLGYTDISLFENGYDCLSRITEDPDMVLLDYQMPGINGEEVLRSIRNYNKEIFVVIISGQDDMQTAVDVMNAGAFDYIIKGKDDEKRLNEIFEKMYRMLEVHQKRKMAFSKIYSLTYYAGEKNWFDSEELRMLKEAARDVSLALEHYAEDILVQEIGVEMLNELNFSSSIINSMPGIFCLFNKEGAFLRWNKNLEAVSGYSAVEIEEMKPEDFFEENTREKMSLMVEDVFMLGEKSILAEIATKNQARIPYYLTGKAIEYKGSTCLLGIGIDFSERLRAQEKIKEYTEKLHQLTAYLQEVREEERKRIGREIHDELGQQLTAIKMDVAWVNNRLPEEFTDIKKKLWNITHMLNGSNSSVRRILNELRPSMLDDYGLSEAIEWVSRQFRENTQVDIELSLPDHSFKIPEKIITAIFRIYQEALTNITRHADATSVKTVLNLVDNKIILNVTDNGKGFETSMVNKKNSFGLLGIRERVLSLNGQYSLISSPGSGTSLHITLPLNKYFKKSKH